MLVSEYYQFAVDGRQLADDAPEAYGIERLLSLGEGFKRQHVGEIINETLGVTLSSMEAADVGLALPAADLNFDSIAAPAGLAAMAWK